MNFDWGQVKAGSILKVKLKYFVKSLNDFTIFTESRKEIRSKEMQDLYKRGVNSKEVVVIDIINESDYFIVVPIDNKQVSRSLFIKNFGTISIKPLILSKKNNLKKHKIIDTIPINDVKRIQKNIEKYSKTLRYMKEIKIDQLKNAINNKKRAEFILREEEG